MSENGAPERLYAADRRAGWGAQAWREMGAELLAGRELAWRLLLRDLSVRYRQSFFGLFWVLLLPLAAMGTFLALSRSNILSVPQTEVPYPVFLLLGLTLWQFFAGGLHACTNALVAGGSMVVKINFPKETLVLAAIGQACFELLPRLLLLGAVCAAYGVAPRWTALLLPVALLPLFMLTLGLGFALSLVNMVFRDMAQVLAVLTPLLMFLTPVAYPPPRSGSLALVMSLNPLSPLVTAARDLVFAGSLTDAAGLAWASALSAAVLLFSWRLFHLAEYKIAEVI